MKNFEHHKPNLNEWAPIGIYRQLELGHGYFIWDYERAKSSKLRFDLKSAPTQLDTAQIPFFSASRMFVISMATGQDFINKTIKN